MTESRWDYLERTGMGESGLGGGPAGSNLAPFYLRRPDYESGLGGDPLQGMLPERPEEEYMPSPQLQQMMMDDLAIRQSEAMAMRGKGLSGGGWGSSLAGVLGSKKLSDIGKERKTYIEQMSESEKKKAVSWNAYVKDYRKGLFTEFQELIRQYKEAKKTETPLDDEEVLINMEELVAKANMDISGDKNNDVYGLGAMIARFRKDRETEMKYAPTAPQIPRTATGLPLYMEEEKREKEKLTEELKKRYTDAITYYTTRFESFDEAKEKFYSDYPLMIQKGFSPKLLDALYERVVMMWRTKQSWLSKQFGKYE